MASWLRRFAAVTLVSFAFAPTRPVRADDGDRQVTVAVDAGGTLVYVTTTAAGAATVARQTGGTVEAVAVATPVVALDTSGSSLVGGDPYRYQQWALTSGGFKPLNGRADGHGIVVAVIDTGVTGSHEDLTGSVTNGGDTTGAGQDAAMTDLNGHGTHVAGIVAAHRGNNLGVSGAAPGATVLSLRALASDGSGWSTNVARAITDAVRAGAKIINLSLGGPRNALLTAAVQDAVDHGVLVVAGVGNNGDTGNEPMWPGADPNVIGVGATTPVDQRASWSSYGPQVDIAAPGDHILSTDHTNTSSYVLMSGTSMASPLVAAAAADIWSMYPNASAAQVRAALERSARDVGTPGRDNDTGHGVVDAAGALAALGAAVGTTGTFPANVFHPVDPVRVFDTRDPSAGTQPVTGGPLDATRTAQVDLTGPGATIPATDVAAAVLNVTVTNTHTAGFVTVYPCGTRREVASVNFDAGATVGNEVTATLSGDGEMCIYASSRADVIVDLDGWFAADAGFHPDDPRRLFDSRPGTTSLTAGGGGLLGAGSVTEIGVVGLDGVTPAGWVDAVSVNVTAVGARGDGYVTLYPCGTRPVTSSLNYAAGATVGNAAVVQVSTSGTICVFTYAATDVVIDINGWFESGTTFHAQLPTRLFDAREFWSSLARPVTGGDTGGTTLIMPVTGLAGVTPDGAVAGVLLVITAITPPHTSFVTVYPCGQRREVSSLNFTAHQIAGNEVIVPVSADGKICVYSPAPVQLTVDLGGWFETVPAS